MYDKPIIIKLVHEIIINIFLCHIRYYSVIMDTR